ncbi:hypothetical protein [Kocuria sabuli]|uniref:hypothetical protein n=1 Tax=Kocuria sabuli TaxID=3071448 RepID=UPI0034D6C4F3
MSKHIEIVVSQPQSTHQREGAPGEPTEDPRSRHSEIELHKRGVRGAFLFDGGAYGHMAGELVAVYHHRRGYPEWTRFSSDPREAWLKLSPAAQEQLFGLDLSDGHPDLDVPLADVPDVEEDSLFYPGWLGVYDGPESADLHLIGADLAGFLWVIREYERQHGEPLRLKREDGVLPGV